MNKIKRSIALLKASNQVVRSHPVLLIYPALSAIAVLSVLIFITAPIIGGSAFLMDRAGILPSIESDTAPWQFTLISAIAFLAVSFVSILSSATMFVAAETALNGEEPSLRQSLGSAWRKRKNIFKWTIFSAVVGYLIQMAYEKLSWLGVFAKVGAILAGLAWSLAVVFIIPVLVKHDVGPIEALKRSTALLKRAWGERVTADVSIGIFTLFIVLLALIFPAIALTVLVINGILSMGLGIAISATLFAIFIAITMYLASLNSIFSAALYRYAETGDYVGPYTPEMINGAFRPLQNSKKFWAIK